MRRAMSLSAPAPNDRPVMTHFHLVDVSSFRVALTSLFLLAALTYVRGWVLLRSAWSPALSPLRAASFLAAVLMIWVAMNSPLATLDHEWLTAHMVQHLLLMSVAPLLIWLSAPIMPMLFGLPGHVVAATIGPLVRSRSAQRMRRAMTRPVVCWLAAAVTLAAWHVPAAHSLGMHSHAWHFVQQGSFLVAGLLFWWPVVRPWPSARRAPQWSMVLYLFLSTLPCDVLGAFLVFSERVAYPVYLSSSGRFYGSVLRDQQAAGALMWTVVTIIYLAAAAILSMRLLAARPVGYREQRVVESVYTGAVRPRSSVSRAVSSSKESL